MAQLNENLIRAMVWDLKEVVNVSTALSSWMGKIDCMSWRYPSQQSQSVDVLSIFNNLNGSAGEYYVNLLEFIYDRLLLILNLLIKFVDDFSNPSTNFGMPKNIIRPQHLSLGGLLNTFWSRMQSLQNSMIGCMATRRENFEMKCANRGTGFETSNSSNISHGVVSRNCQTDLMSLTSCENCHLNEELMGKIITWVETNSLDICSKSSVATERQDIVHRTQWQSMTRWAAAIEEDLSTLLAAFKEAKQTNAKLTKLICLTENRWEKKALASRECIKKLKIKCRHSSANLALKENELSLMNKKWQEIFGDKEDGYRILEKKLKLTGELLTESTAQEKRTRKTLEDLQRQLDDAVREKDTLAIEVRDLRRTQRPEGHVKLPAVEGWRNRQAPGQTGKMHGNPATDMRDQIQANQARIQQLQAENARLAGTLAKLHAFNARNATDVDKK